MTRHGTTSQIGKKKNNGGGEGKRCRPCRLYHCPNQKKGGGKGEKRSLVTKSRDDEKEEEVEKKTLSHDPKIPRSSSDLSKMGDQGGADDTSYTTEQKSSPTKKDGRTAQSVQKRKERRDYISERRGGKIASFEGESAANSRAEQDSEEKGDDSNRSKKGRLPLPLGGKMAYVETASAGIRLVLLSDERDLPLYKNTSLNKGGGAKKKEGNEYPREEKKKGEGKVLSIK